jgi:hypothetical protein
MATLFDFSTTNNSNYTVTPWKGNNPQNTTNPNSVWIQDPNDGKWLFITPGGQTTTVGAPPVTAVPPATDPCAEIKRQLLNAKYKAMITDLQGKLTLKNESGFWENNNSGDFTPLNSSDALSVDIPFRSPNIKGFTHVHMFPFFTMDKSGKFKYTEPIPMFSPPDIGRFVDLLRNAQVNNIPTGSIYAGMLSPEGNYQLRFAGNIADINNTTFPFDSEATKYSYETLMDYNKDTPERGILIYLQYRLKINGIELYKIENDGTATKKSLDPNTEKTTSNPCK